MYRYAQEGSTDSVIRIADGKVIRMVHTDPLSKAVELWISRGNKPLPAEPIKVMEPTKESEPIEEPEKQYAQEVSTDSVIDYVGDPDPQPKKKTKKWRELLDKK